MKIEKKTQWLCLCTLGAALTVGVAPLALGQDAAGNEHPTAPQLYLQGTQLLESGRLLEAKEILERVDLPQLERAQRTDVIERLSKIELLLQQMPETELRLRKAQLFLERGDLRQAVQHAAKVVALEDASAEQQQNARAIIANVETRQNEIRRQIPTLLENSFQAFEDGNYGQAKSGLQFVFNSGVALDLDQQARLNRYLEKVYRLEAVRGEFNATEINLGTLQPAEQEPAVETIVEETEATQPDQTAEDTAVQEEAVAETPEEVVVEETQPEPGLEPEPEIDLSDLIRQAQEANAENLLDQARAARAQGRYEDALAQYNRVLAIRPAQQEALEGRDAMQVAVNRGINDGIQDREIQAAAVMAEFDNLLEQSAINRDAGSFNDALNQVSQARVLLDRNRNLLSQNAYEQRRAAASSLAADINAQEHDAVLAEAMAQAEEIDRVRQGQRMQLELERQRKITQKMIAIRRLQLAQKYDEALLELKALLFLDPGNAVAQALQDIIQQTILARKYNAQVRDTNRRLSLNSMDLFEAQRLPVDVIEFPEDWPEISIIRQGGIAALDSAQDRYVSHALASSHVPIDFNGVRLEQAINFIAEVAEINVDVDWASLEQNFIDRNTPINLKLNDKVSLNTVLERILQKLGTDEEARPRYAITDGILTISTKEKLQQNKLTHLYDIRDLLVDVPDFDNAPEFDLESLIKPRNDRGFGMETFGATEGHEYERGIGERREKIDQIKQVLTTTIDKLSWEVNGGDVGVIQELNGNLVVTTTPQNHRQISNLLEKLREIRAIQISVESRFLLVSEDFFEQIGFDLDLYWGGDQYRRDKLTDPNLLPSDLFTNIVGQRKTADFQRQYISLFDAIGRVDDQGNPVLDGNGRQLVDFLLPDAGILEAGRSQWSPTSAQQDSFGISRLLFGAEGASFAGQALGATPALSFAVTYLDNIQVDLLIEATQADRRSVQLTAPKLTFFNGQRSFMQVTTSQFFVSDLQPIVGTGSAGFDPELSPLREGVVLDVQGTVSADRRYVTMTVLTTLAKVLDIKTTEVPIVVGGTVLGSGDNDAEVLSNSAFIERPEIQIARVNTTVSVPDRGTILLGGQSIRNDIEIETGVPVLSKIPLLNRFFTNRIMSTEERTLYILMRPHIIIQQEMEDQLFPGLQDAIRGTGGLGGQF